MNTLDVLLIAMAAAAGIQFLYFLFFFLRVAWYRNKTPKSIPSLHQSLMASFLSPRRGGRATRVLCRSSGLRRARIP